MSCTYSSGTRLYKHLLVTSKAAVGLGENCVWRNIERATNQRDVNIGRYLEAPLQLADPCLRFSDLLPELALRHSAKDSHGSKLSID